MSSLGRLHSFLSTPFSLKDPYINPRKKGVILLSGTFSKEASSLIKIARYVVLLASYILPVVARGKSTRYDCCPKGTV